MRNNDPLSSAALTEILKIQPSHPTRIRRRESTKLEFKESYRPENKGNYLKTIASFANNEGGYIIFGIKDSPREMIGLSGRRLEKFDNIKLEVFTQSLLDYFAPEIHCEFITFEIKNLKFGVLYTYPLKDKPCICKKNMGSILKEGDIYYRYGGESKLIQYSELRAILNKNEKEQEKKWIRLIQKTAKIGIQNASLFDLTKGIIDGDSKTIVFDKDLLSQITFVREGHFNDNGGKPTLKLIGSIENGNISTGKLILTNNTKRVVKYIEPHDIVTQFLELDIEDKNGIDGLLKAICSTQSANYPVYFFLYKTGTSIETAKAHINDFHFHNHIKNRFIQRLNGKLIKQISVPDTNTKSAKVKHMYRDFWLKDVNGIDIDEENLNYAFEAILSLSSNEIISHQKVIFAFLKAIYTDNIESLKGIMLTNFRKALCYVDESIYLPHVREKENP